MRLACLVALLSLLVSPAHASGPVERLLQVLLHPSQPERMVIRYGAGVGSHGYLFSRDGGRTFQLLCSAIVAPESPDALAIQRVSQRPIPATAATVLDANGAVMFAQYGATWSDDGTGCSWHDVPELRGKWPLGLKLDPREPTLLWSVVNTGAPANSGQRGKLEIARRDGETWKSVASIRKVDADKVVIDASLAVFANAKRRRLLSSVVLMGAGGASAGYVLRSDDDGAHWKEFALPKEQERLNLLAIDPTNPERVLAAIARDGSADTLLLSVDGGATFTTYLEPRAVGGVGFDEAGRVYLGDTGDGVTPEQEGGLYTAAQVGEPLTKVPNTAAIDCVTYDPQGKRLLVCNGERFGVIDLATGAIAELVRLDAITEFVSCPGKDLHAICQNQLNAGPSWCCAGHYPFTPLCGSYDVTTRPDNGRVLCGLAGREYDQPDAGMPAPPPEAEPAREVPRDDEAPWARVGMALLLAALVAFLVRRRR